MPDVYQPALLSSAPGRGDRSPRNCTPVSGRIVARVCSEKLQPFAALRRHREYANPSSESALHKFLLPQLAKIARHLTRKTVAHRIPIWSENPLVSSAGLTLVAAGIN